MSFGSLPSVLGNGGGVAISVIGGTGLFADGTAAAPSISFAADTDTGFYRAGANVFTATAGGLGVMNFSRSGGSNGGRLSGTVVGNEFNLFDLGGISLTAAGTNQNITLTPSGTGFVATTSLIKSTMTPATAGYQGGYTLTDAATVTAALGLQDTGGASCPFVYGNTKLGFGANGATWMYLLGTGRLLLGTGSTDSGALLQIGTNTTGSSGGVILGTDCPFYRIAAGIVRADFDFRVNGNLNLSTNTINALGGSLVFASNNTTALTLDSSQNAKFAGNAVVGGGNAAGASTLTVNYSSATKEPIGIVNTNTGGKSWYVGDGTGTSNGNFGFRNATDSITTLIITSGGDGIFAGRIFPQQAVTASAPAYSKGAMYFDTTLNKLRIGGATAWETVTSV